MEFSPLGLVVGLAILAPSLLLLAFPPRDGIARIVGAGPVITAIERIGQVGCLAALAFSGSTAPAFTIWAVLVTASILAYYGLWARYLLRGRTAWLLFSPLWFVPIPMAVFPILAFAFAAAWTRSPLLAVAVGVLAFGHGVSSWFSMQRLRPSSPRRAAAEGDESTP